MKPTQRSKAAAEKYLALHKAYPDLADRKLDEIIQGAVDDAMAVWKTAAMAPEKYTPRDGNEPLASWQARAYNIANP